MRHVATLLVLSVMTLAPDFAAAQSFKCKRAHYPDEKLICAEAALSRLDEQLATAYDNAMRRLSPQRAQELDEEEEIWVVQRRRCGANYSCIERRYLDRLAELAAIASAARSTSAADQHHAARPITHTKVPGRVATAPPSSAATRTASPPDRRFAPEPKGKVTAGAKLAPAPDSASVSRPAASTWINPAPTE
jgi:uncharacterized protein